MSEQAYFEEFLNILREHKLLADYSIPDETPSPSHLTANSKDVIPGTFYICKGASFKKDYLVSAANQGAVLYMSEHVYSDVSLPYIVVTDVRRAMSLAARMFYGCPGDSLIKVGATGTKGKTTVTFVMKDILDIYTQGKCAAFSTHEINIGAEAFETTLTTPEPIELQSYFSRALDAGCTHTIMEVSSQAMKMSRIYGETYKVGVFTNIDCDHISPTEHASMEDYLACKIAFLRQCENVVLYAGTRYFDEVYESVQDKHVVIYGVRESVLEIAEKLGDKLSSGTEFAMICDGELRADGSGFSLIYGGERREHETNLIGDYNVENVAAAIVSAHLLDIPNEIIRAGIKDVYVPGRLQLYHHRGSMFMIDYAHNYLSMYRLYQMVRSTLKPESITAVFGCGGERYKKRREDMGRLAEQYADKVILTMEDPGFESCEDICKEIKQYITKPCEIIVDRESAVRRALDTAKPGELVIITGKGVESTQRICGQFVECHSDAQVIEQWLVEHE